MVFGMPMLLIGLTYPYPQEVFMLLVAVSSVFVFSNGLYMVFFCPFLLRKMEKAMKGELGQGGRADPDRRSKEAEVVHWVAFPNYQEDLDILAAAIESVAQSSIAKTQICVLLAMEEREVESRGKA